MNNFRKSFKIKGKIVYKPLIFCFYLIKLCLNNKNISPNFVIIYMNWVVINARDDLPCKKSG